MHELKLLACIFVDSDCIKDIIGTLEPKHFRDSINQMIYAKCLEMYSRNFKVDATVISEMIVRENESLSDIIQIRIAEILKTGFTSTNIVAFAQLIIDTYLNTQYQITVSNRKETDVHEKIGNTINELTELFKNKENKSISIKDVYEHNKHKFFNPDYKPKKYYLGLINTDAIIGGLENTDICVIGARPAVGKSAFVSQTIIKMAMTHKKIMFYSLEMSEFQIYERFLAYKSGIPMASIKYDKQFANINDEIRYKKAVEELNNLDIIINDEGGKTVSDIRNECKYIDKLDCIVIDYLQLIKAESHYKGNRAAEVGQISKDLKALAMELKIPIIVLSQLNRAVKGRYEKEPTMEDLRESGDIEQDASVIVLLWNVSEESKELKGIKIDKNRHGNTGKLMLEFNGSTMTFKESNKPLPVKTEKQSSNPFIEKQKIETVEETPPF